MSEDMDILFFDAGETLIHPIPSFPELFSVCCADFGLEVDFALLAKIGRKFMAEVEEKQREGYTFTDDHEASRKFWLGFYSVLVGALGYAEAHDALPERLYEVFSLPANYGLYDDVMETLQSVAARGMRMGLISNFEAWLQDLLDEQGISDHFEVIVISGNEGVEKPNPGIYRLALERAGVEPGRALHVGDSPISDYAGALDVGIQAVLLDRWGRFPDFDGPRIENLTEITRFLEEK